MLGGACVVIVQVAPVDVRPGSGVCGLNRRTMFQYVQSPVKILNRVSWSLWQVAKVVHCFTNGIQRYVGVEVSSTQPSDEVTHVEVK